MLKINISKVLFVVLFLIFQLPPRLLSGTGYIIITSNNTNIRIAPNSTIITQAKTGDVFELKGTEGNWYKINMFSGEWRYVHNSCAKPTNNIPSLPSSIITRKTAYQKLVKAQDRSVAEAQKAYPYDFKKQIDYERFLYDKYELPVCHIYNIPVARYRKLIAEGVSKNWTPSL